MKILHVLVQKSEGTMNNSGSYWYPDNVGSAIFIFQVLSFSNDQISVLNYLIYNIFKVIGNNSTAKLQTEIRRAITYGWVSYPPTTKILSRFKIALEAYLPFCRLPTSSQLSTVYFAIRDSESPSVLPSQPPPIIKTEDSLLTTAYP